MTRKNRPEPKAQVGDYIRKDGELVRVERVAEEDGDIAYYTSDGGCIADDEVNADEILLESEAYDEFHRKR